MTFTYDSFLRPSSTNDKNIIIQDSNGKVIHTINPYAVINTFVSNNLLKISLSSDRVITLNFIQTDLAKQALNILQTRITSLKVDTPTFIDKQVENYVTDYVDTKISENTITQIINLTNASGALNYVPRWISASALSATGSIIDTGSNVTIGRNTRENTSLVNIRGTRDTWNGVLTSTNSDVFYGQPWFKGGYGLTSSALFIQGTIDGLTTNQAVPSAGNLGGYFVGTGDPRPLVRMSATGWGTTLLVENNTPSIGTPALQGAQTVPTYFRGPDPLFIWEDTSTARQLILERTSIQFEWRTFVSPLYAQYRNITFQRSGFTHEFVISATVNAGTYYLPTLFAEGYTSQMVGLQVYSGQGVVVSPSIDQTIPSSQITFGNLTGRNEVVPGMVITPTPTGTNYGEGVNRRYDPVQNKWVNLFPNTTITVQSVIGNTVVLSAAPSLALKTTDKIYFTGQIAPGTKGLGRALVKIDNGVPVEYTSGAPIGSVYVLKVNQPLVRTLYPGDTFVVSYPAGGVGIGTGGRLDYKLNVEGGALIDRSIILQNGKITTPFFKMAYGAPFQSNFNLMVGDQFGDSRWVPAGQVVGSGFTGTSSTQLTIGTAGSYFQIKTQPFLSFRPGQVVVVYDELGALYLDPNYQNGFGSNKIIAEIDGYSFSSGTMSLVTLYSQNVGSASNSWSIQLSGAVGPQGPAGFNQGTFSVTGDIIPSEDYTFNLGSPTKRWDNIYVKDAFVASQSLYLGDDKVSTSNGIISFNNVAINKYGATSSTPYTIGQVGSYLQLQTEKNLSYLRGEFVKVQNRIKSAYEDDGYSEESEYGFFKANVDDYDPVSGIMDLIIIYTDNIGFYSDFWLLDIDVDNLGFENQVSKLPQVTTSLKLIGSSKDSISIPEVGFVRTFFIELGLGFSVGHEVMVYTGQLNNYDEDNYVDDSSPYFIGRVDSYYPGTGEITVVCDYSVGNGTYEDWTVVISSSKGFGFIEKNVYTDGQNYDFIAVNFDNMSLSSSVFDVNSEFVSIDSAQNIQILADNDITIFPGGQLNLVGNTTLQSTSQIVQNNITVTSSTINYNFYNGQVWYHDNLTTDYTANFTNLPNSNNRITKATIIITQGLTAYTPTSLKIDGNNQNIKWKSGYSGGNTMSTDIVEFDFLRINGTWSGVFGQINNFV